MLNGKQKPATIQERFEEFNREHPEVYTYLIALVYEVLRKGYSHYGIRTLWERMRWHFHIEKGDNEFKLNDHFHSRYARKIMAEHPDLDGFFELRELKAE